MQNTGRPNITAAGVTDSETFAFCATCNNISYSERDECSWCGSQDLKMLTLRDIAACLRDTIQNPKNRSYGSTFGAAHENDV